MKLNKIEYKGNLLYFYDDEFEKIGFDIIDKKLEIVKELKNTKRNYVAIIKVCGKKYVLKEPRNEYRIPQRQLMTFFKKGESLTTLINVNEMIDEYKVDYIRPYLAIVKRKRGVIVYSSILMEYCEGEPPEERDKKELVKKIIEVHKLGRYHGDFNPSNFLKDQNGNIRILDTQAKKIGLTKYRPHYDMLTMQRDSYKEMEYPYKKDFSYYLALGVKKFKRLKFIEAIKKKKKELRDRGWRI